VGSATTPAALACAALLLPLAPCAALAMTCGAVQVPAA
jgi:hypothetical protein